MMLINGMGGERQEESSVIDVGVCDPQLDAVLPTLRNLIVGHKIIEKDPVRMYTGIFIRC